MKEPNLNQIQKMWHGSFKAYMIGLTLSFLLTVIAFGLVGFKVISGVKLQVAVTVLAILQAFAQLFFFLHMGKEDKPRWETMVFCFMVLVVLIIVLGTLWIMFDLDNRVMSGMRH